MDERAEGTLALGIDDETVDTLRHDVPSTIAEAIREVEGEAPSPCKRKR
jgi:hypothetical protein